VADKVTIYTKPGCPYCAAAKRSLDKKGIEYEEFNARADRAALHRMLDLNGGRRRVPTIVEGEKVTVGFNGY
jgi:glutaredoxin